jgi:hypothetical protein
MRGLARLLFMPRAERVWLALYGMEMRISKSVRVSSATALVASVANATATLGGATVNAVFLPGSYVNRQYTIVNAANTVSGTINPAVTSNMANMQSTLSYDAHDAFLNIKLVFVPPPSGSLNANQQNVANALADRPARHRSPPPICPAMPNRRCPAPTPSH